MAIRVLTTDPKGLLSEIKIAIDSSDIVTWSYDSDGDFTHTPSQWKNQAWLRPKIEETKLIFHILARKDTKMSRTIYAVYHGRFAEMLLIHFDLKFTDVRLSALPQVSDRVDTTK